MGERPIRRIFSHAKSHTESPMIPDLTYMEVHIMRTPRRLEEVVKPHYENNTYWDVSLYNHDKIICFLKV